MINNGGAARVRDPRAARRDLRTAARDLEDAAAVLVVLTALAGGQPGDPTGPAPGSWGSPAHRLGVDAPGARSWWISGLPR